MPASHGS